MTRLDRYSQALSTSSAEACDAYVAAVDCLLAAGVDGERAFANVTALDPAFALPYVGRARCLALYGRGVEARAAAARGRELAASATRRERQHVEALALGIEGRSADALALTLMHLDEFPRDAMVLAPATGVFGLYGFSGHLDRERVLLALMDRLAPHYGEDWWFLGQHAFAECECGRLASAEARVERSLALNPAGGHAAHVRAHVYYELGQDQASAQFLTAWRQGYPRGGQMHCHISWHAAMCALMLGDPARAQEIYMADIRPGGSEGPPLNVLTDSVALLWRLELAGHQRRPGVWSEIRAFALDRYPKAGVTFADVHNAIVFAASGDAASAERLASELVAGIGRQWAADIAEPIARGMAAFAREDWSSAIAAIAPVASEAVRIGGSRAQRDLVHYTLLAAYLRAGRGDEARALIASYTDRHPTVPTILSPASRCPPP